METIIKFITCKCCFMLNFLNELVQNVVISYVYVFCLDVLKFLLFQLFFAIA